MQRKVTYGIAITVISVVSVWFYFTPYIAANNIKKAAEANDSATLSSYINFPSLKESLKANFNAMLAAEVVKSKEGNLFEAMGAALAAAFINPMIDALVTPESLAMMMQGRKPNLEKGESKTGKKPGGDSDTEMTMGYESYDRFAVSVRKKGDTDAPVTFVFHREGILTWKLASLRLPTQKAKEQQVTSTPQAQQTTQSLQLTDLSKYVGQHPTKVFNELSIQEKFKALLGNEYGHFFENLSVSSELELKGNLYVGSGCAPHVCGIEESAFAINRETGEIFASILSNGETIKSYGVASEQNLPAPLYAWYKEHGGQN